MHIVKAALLAALGSCIFLLPLMGIDIYKKEGVTVESAFALVILLVLLAVIIWQFMLALQFGVHKRVAIVGKVSTTGTGKRWIETDIPGFGLWDLEVPGDMAMRKGDIVKLAVKVDCRGPDPRIVPIKFGNINDVR